MEFLDFVVRISRDGDGHNVAVVQAPAGEASGRMSLAAHRTKIRDRLQVARCARAQGGTTRHSGVPVRDLSAALQIPSRPAETIKQFGSELFEALFPAEVRTCYRNSLSMARAQSKGLRIRLRIDAPALTVLPWEFLYDQADREYVCLVRETPLIRYLELTRPPQPFTIRPPLRVLAMVASPSDLPQLDVQEEKQLMAEAIRHLRDEGLLSLHWLEGATWRDLQRELRDGPWHVFHFIGHGDFDETEGLGQVAFVDEQGMASRLSATQLGRLLASHRSLRLVVLNACEGARASETNPFSSTGAVLTQRGIPAVISMQDVITDRSALEFSRMFYDAVANGLAVDEAVTEARIAMSMTVDDSLEWGNPVLYMRSTDGRLFEIDAAGAIFPKAGSSLEDPAQMPEGEDGDVFAKADAARPLGPLSAPVSPVSGFVPEPLVEEPRVTPTQKPLAEGEVPRGLPIMLRKVKQFWIEGVLNNSLDQSGLIDLEYDTLPDMVDSPWGSTPLDPKQPIASLCDELGGSFLILGVPGAGKTTIMLSLVRELISRAEKEYDRAIPVVFNLTSWAEHGGDLIGWLTAELASKYGIPKKVGDSWVRQGQLWLFLDGLDEVLAYRRSDCVEAINAYVRQASLANVVVCCRFNEYTELPLRLMLNGALRLRTLSRDHVTRHLKRSGSRLETLSMLLQRDSSLQVLAQTPFMLSMMIRTYRNLPQKELDQRQFATVETRKRQLIEAYVQRQFRLVFQGGPGA